MEFLDLSYPGPAANLACDEALLDLREKDGGNGILRFWQSTETFVVVGYANKIQAEVNVARCEADRIPIFRRCSGGGTVLQGAGCLNYALILQITPNSALSEISSANKYIMDRNREAIQSIAGGSLSIMVQGHTDLAVRGSSAVFRKFSGNSQRRHKAFLLFHGTYLLNFDLELVERYLKFPSRQPDYRADRGHGQFLMNLNLPATAVKEAMKTIWEAEYPLPAPKMATAGVAALARDKYSTPEWNLKFFHL
ncbi:MAG TPA: lipoate--protein ligase family protein [Candidatus Sulfotelmatobacter sp.]|nr:lipoate--protein ligase family protein [Candidatus Sulfotelmatobacter sp.]